MTLVAKEPLPDDAEVTFVYQKPQAAVHNEFTAILEIDEDWFVAHCLEVPGAHGQGKTREDALENLAEALLLHLEVRRESGLRGVPDHIYREVIAVR